MPIPAPSPTPSEVFRQLLDGICAGRYDQVPDLYADECHVSHPFGIPEPTHMYSRAELVTHFAGARSVIRDLKARDVVIHQTTDPEVVVGEFTYDGHRADGTPFTVDNIFVMRVRDGKIVESRDYHNHAALAATVRQAG